MKRRAFLVKSSQVGMSAAASSILLGCGGGSSVEELISQVDTVSPIDKEIVALNTRQDKIEDTHVKIQSNLDFPNAQVKDLYAKTSPEYTERSVLNDNYLTHVNSDKNLWENAQSAHQIAYDQYKHQYTKMKAALRLFEHQHVNTAPTTAQAKSISLPERSADVTGEDETLNNLLSLLESMTADTLTTTTLELIASALKFVFDKLSVYLENDVDAALDYAYATYLMIEELLNLVKEKALSELDFSSGNAILLSLAKVTVASVSVLTLSSLQSLNLAKTDLSADQENVYSFLTLNSLDSKISSLWMDISSKTTLSTIDALKKSVSESVQTGEIPDNTTLIQNLKSKSQLMAITAVTIKELFAKVADNASAYATSDMSFTSDSTADNFKILFGSDKNPYDEALSQTVYAQKSTFSAYEPTLSDTTSKVFKVSVTNESRKVTTDIENEAYQFATELASVSYNIVESTEEDAVDFATHLADLAYAFVMDIEEDAFQFAMQGMEYGYLFASRGEEVGLMADRILWMAVQIGVMADRIGEMADRILYTEQMIVYTEILILDFGILIYGFGSQVSNIILTGLALIFDREWYTYESNDLILETINNHAMTMLDNMHEYSLAMLEHQNELRALTLEALKVLPYAEPTQP